jgi:hypothetical protein
MVRTPKINACFPNAGASVLIQVKMRRMEADALGSSPSSVVRSNNGPPLFTTSFDCSQPHISANGRDATRAEVSLADDPAERQFAAEWDLLNTRFGAWRFVLAFAAKNFSGSLRHCAPSLCE